MRWQPIGVNRAGCYREILNQSTTAVHETVPDTCRPCPTASRPAWWRHTGVPVPPRHLYWTTMTSSSAGCTRTRTSCGRHVTSPEPISMFCTRTASLTVGCRGFFVKASCAFSFSHRCRKRGAGVFAFQPQNSRKYFSGKYHALTVTFVTLQQKTLLRNKCKKNLNSLKLRVRTTWWTRTTKTAKIF